MNDSRRLMANYGPAAPVVPAAPLPPPPPPQGAWRVQGTGEGGWFYVRWVRREAEANDLRRQWRAFGLTVVATRWAEAQLFPHVLRGLAAAEVG